MLKKKKISAVSCWSQIQEKVISINVLLLHIQSHSARKEAGVFYSEWPVLVKLQTAVREDAGRGAEEGLFWGFGCALFSNLRGRESDMSGPPSPASFLPL